jgi:hypothetical protein
VASCSGYAEKLSDILNHAEKANLYFGTVENKKNPNFHHLYFRVVAASGWHFLISFQQSHVGNLLVFRA